MEARAQARFIRVTPRKARRVVDLIRGMPAAEAQAVLRFAPQAASEPVGKVLASAIANAEHNNKLAPHPPGASRPGVAEGPPLRRSGPGARGGGSRVNKRRSHITVIVQARPDGAEAPRKGNTKK